MENEKKIRVYRQVPGEELFCLEGNYGTLCNGCLPADMSVEEYYYLMSPEGGCGAPRACGGQLEIVLDWLNGDVNAQVRQPLLNYSSHDLHVSGVVVFRLIFFLKKNEKESIIFYLVIIMIAVYMYLCTVLSLQPPIFTAEHDEQYLTPG